MLEVLAHRFHEADIGKGSPFLSTLRNNGDPLGGGPGKCIL